ncbi:MAG: hypothetical protein CL470_00690 [Acidimicrobiaceae bacterium]|nr:hypothetical protein [Acidimicrobiaceae bacterium]|tara:strand:+ start:260 stop:1159 length:900 start_codon:yes stop_codon:yes gene_type:complete
MKILSHLDTIHYKIGEKIYNLIQYKDHNHLLIYGKEKVGKSFLINTIFNIQSAKLLKNDHFSYHNHLNNYFINCHNIINKSEFIKFLKDLCNTYDHYQLNHKYIILDNYQTTTDYIQNSLKVIIEKSYFTTKFILITNNLTKVIKAIQSRFQYIRIPNPKSYDKYIYIKNNYNPNILYSDCSKYDLPILIHIHNLPYKDKIKEYCLQIIHILESKIDITLIDKIRKFSSEVKEMNLPLNILFSNLIDFIIIKKKEDQQIINMINIIAEYEHSLHFSYRDIIYIESLILNLYKVFNNIIV